MEASQDAHLLFNREPLAAGGNNMTYGQACKGHAWPEYGRKGMRHSEQKSVRYKKWATDRSFCCLLAHRLERPDCTAHLERVVCSRVIITRI